MGLNSSKDTKPGPSKTDKLKSSDIKGSNQLSETEIEFIVNKIGNEWVQLSRKLGLCETDETGINQGPGSLRNKVYQVIDKWKQNNGNNATKEKMIQCLRNIQRQDIVDELPMTTGQLPDEVFGGFKQQVVKLYSHLNVPLPPRINKDISIDSIFIDQELEVFTLTSQDDPEILNLESLIQNIKQHKMLRTLVEGDPGFGKTTLASKIATDWAKKKEYISSHFDLVLLIPLREVGDQHILNFIVDMINRANKCTTFTVKNIEEYFDQGKVLLLLDGYDEMSPESHKRIYPVLEKNNLKNTCILVTSRRGFFTIKQGAINSSKSLTFQHENVLYNFWDARVILKGVSKDQRTKYLKDHFEIRSDTLNNTNELFKNNADELFRCPLLVFWLGWMLETYGQQDIRTRTSFYKRLVNLILHKTLVREDKIQEDDAFDIFSTSTDDELTISIQQQIIEFGELAMQKMIANDVLFNKADLKSVENSILLKSDLMISYKALTKQQEQTIYQPMHRSFLEFLVAFNVCYSSNDINTFKKNISTLIEKRLNPSLHSMLYPFIAGLLEAKSEWLFEALSTWSHEYSVLKPSMMNIFPELKGAETYDLLQQMLNFIPEYSNIGYLQQSHNFSSSLVKHLLELAAEKQLISVIKWYIDYPFPVSKVALNKLYVITGYRNQFYSALDNIFIHCKKLIYQISKPYDNQCSSLKQLLSVCRNVNAEEIELHLTELEFKECDFLFDEIQKGMNEIKFQSVNCYRCQLKNKHVNVLAQLVESNCITKGITINNNDGKIESDSLSELWESVMKSSSITEFTLQDVKLDGMLSFKISMPFQLQLLHLEGGRFSIELDSATSIQNLTLLNVANDDNVMNALDCFKHVNYFCCNDWLLDRCLSNKVSFLATVTELHLVIKGDFSHCPSFIQVMPSLTVFTLNAFYMRRNLTSVEECVISALESTTNSSCSETKQLKVFRIHFIPTFEVFQFFVNCFTKVKSMNIECLELSLDYDDYLEAPGLTNTMHKLIDLLRNDNITQLNLIDTVEYFPVPKIAEFVRKWFSEEPIQIKKRFCHNDQQLRLISPLYYYNRVSHNIYYIELKKRLV